MLSKWFYPWKVHAEPLTIIEKNYYSLKTLQETTASMCIQINYARIIVMHTNVYISVVLVNYN